MLDSSLLPIILLLCGFVLIVIELFVPSGGTIGVLAAGVIMGAIIFAFMRDVYYGLILSLVTLVSVPLLLTVLFRIWPHTPIGKKILINRPSAEDVLPRGEDYDGLKKLIGKSGIARSKMLPSGSIRIEGKTYDAFADGVAIEKGQEIEVIAIRTNRIVVRAIINSSRSIDDDDDLFAKSADSLELDWDEPV